MRHLAAVSCIVSAVVCVPALAETTYSLSRCAADGNSVSLAFVGTAGRVRRMHLGLRGIELSGDVKGSAQLSSVREIQLQPKLVISYATGSAFEFGKLTNRCAANIRTVAKVLSVAVRGSDG